MSSENVNRGLAGLRLLSLESRRADQMARLIENHGRVGLGAPSMREIPLRDNSAALAFAEDLFAGKLWCGDLPDGNSTRILFGAVETKHPREKLMEALSRLPVVARGPKPIGVSHYNVRVVGDDIEIEVWKTSHLSGRTLSPSQTDMDGLQAAISPE